MFQSYSCPILVPEVTPPTLSKEHGNIFCWAAVQFGLLSLIKAHGIPFLFQTLGCTQDIQYKRIHKDSPRSAQDSGIGKVARSSNSQGGSIQRPV